MLIDMPTLPRAGSLSPRAVEEAAYVVAAQKGKHTSKPAGKRQMGQDLKESIDPHYEARREFTHALRKAQKDTSQNPQHLADTNDR